MTENPKIDIRRWDKKVNTLLKNYGPTVEKIVAYGNTKVSRSVNRNLSGGEYYPGKLPVTRVTGTLSRAYTIRKVTPYLFIHFMDSRVANYAGYVHDGTRYMKPRPYFKNGFNDNRQAIMNYWNYQFILDTRKVGRA